MAIISIEQQLYLAIAFKATNVSVIARAMGMARQNLHSKIIRNTLKKEELCKIAKILGGKYVSYFSFPDGVVISDTIKKRKNRSGG